MNNEEEKSPSTLDKQTNNNNNSNNNGKKNNGKLKDNKNVKPTSTTGSKKNISAGGETHLKEKGLFFNNEHSPSDDVVADEQTSSIDDNLNLRAALYGLLFQTYADTVRNKN